MTVRASVQGATFNMRGQLCRGRANATALSSSPVVSALGSESDAGARRCALETRGKKKKTPLLGLAKSIYYKIPGKLAVRIDKVIS